MPPKNKFTREGIMAAALALAREKGAGAVTARALAERLGSSAKPIFGLFQNMEEVQQEIMAAARRLYQSYMAADMAEGRYPPYKAGGMAYIRFAKEEKELFKLLFMRDRSQEPPTDDSGELEAMVRLIQESLGLTEDDARLFHVEMWIYVHGIATMIATAYLDWEMDFVSQVLTDAYQGLKRCHLERRGEQ